MARAHAERALRLNPRLAWASTAVLQLQSASRDWHSAAETLAQQMKSGLVPEDEGQRKQAALLAAEALAQEDKNRAAALELARKALKLDPALVPAALVAARCFVAEGSHRKAAKAIRAAWTLSPHLDLAEVMAHLKPGDGPDARFERVRDLLKDHEGGLEGACALARAAIRAQRWDVAREALKPHAGEQPQARVCALMADIEDAQGDRGRAREWLARALRAPRDPMWVSDGVASPRWTPVSPVSGEIVPCEWKVPFDMPEESEPDALTAPQGQSAIEAAKPAEKVFPTRPPDDPGLPEDGARGG
jgi:HemY protein